MKLSELNITSSGKEVKCRCPKCDEDRTDKRDKSLAVNTDSGMYYCHYCGERGILEEYMNKRPVDDGKTYNLPKLNTTGLGDEQQRWFVSRGIPISVVNRNRITQSPKGWVEFNYYEGNQLTNIKYRSIREKKFIQHKGGKPILYGLNDIIGEKEVVIVEGEMDKLSMEVIGYPNCVSVPMGGINPNDKSVDGKLKCFEFASDYFEGVESIIIATDNDRNGRRLRDEVARRMGKHRCKWVDFGKYKDSNEVLVEEGKEALRVMILQSHDFPIDQIVEIGDMIPNIVELYEQGIPPGNDSGMGVKFNELYKVKEGYLTVVTGIPTHGKSVFTENIMVNMCRNGWKFGVYSPEHYPFEMYFQRVARIYTGKNFFETDFGNRMDGEDLKKATLFFRDHIYPVTEDTGKTLDELLEIFEQAVFKYGIKGLIIDPWTDLIHDMEGQSETKYISDQLAKIKRFNHKYGVHTWIIAHPTKMMKKEDGSWSVPTLYSISGSANWYNRTDMGFTVFRHENNDVEVFVQKVKQEGIYGKKGSCNFRYKVDSCRYEESMF